MIIKPIKYLAVTILCTILSSPINAQTSVTTDPVGFITLNVKGAGTNQFAFSLVGLGMFNPVDFQGAVTAVPAFNQLTVSGATFDNFTGGQYFVEFLTDPNSSLLVTITSASGDTLTLSNTQAELDLTSGNNAINLADATADTFRIRKHHTLASVFGANNTAGFTGATSAGGADEIILYDPVTQTSNCYFYSTFGTAQWRPCDDAFFGVANDTIIFPESGLIVKRKASTDVNIKLLGAVKTKDTNLAVLTGFNVLANIYPTKVSLLNSGLFTGDSATGVASATSAGAADEVIIYDSATQTSKCFFYSTFGTAQWRPCDDPFFGEANNEEIPIGASIIIKRKNSQKFAWIAPQRPANL